MSTIGDFIGKFFTLSTGSTPASNMSQLGEAATTGHVYLDTRSTQTNSNNNFGGSLMVYNTTKAGWFGVLLTTSTSTTTSTTTSTSTTTTTTTSTT